jgi:hypothetical protein
MELVREWKGEGWSELDAYPHGFLVRAARQHGVSTVSSMRIPPTAQRPPCCPNPPPTTRIMSSGHDRSILLPPSSSPLRAVPQSTQQDGAYILRLVLLLLLGLCWCGLLRRTLDDGGLRLSHFLGVDRREEVCDGAA